MLPEDLFGAGRNVVPFGPGEIASPAQNGEQELWMIERDAIEKAIRDCGGSIPQAARRLGVSPSTIYRKKEAWLTGRPEARA